MKAKLAVILPLMVVGLVLSGQLAYADTIDFDLQYQSCDVNGGNCSAWTLIEDNQSGDMNSRLGVILVSTTQDIWNVVVESGKAGRDPNDPFYPLANLNMSLSSNVTTSGGSGILTVRLSQRNLSPAAPGWNLSWSPTFTGSGLSVGMGAWVAQSNSFFDKQQEIQYFGPTSSASAYSGSGYVDPNLQAPYSITMEVVFKAENATSGAGTTGAGMLAPLQQTSQQIPEPNSLLLLGTGLVFWAVWQRRSSITGRK